MIFKEEQMAAAAMEQAGEWYARHRDGKLTPAETQDFMAWLQASPMHVREYLAAAEVSAHLPAAVHGFTADREELLDRARLALSRDNNVVALRSASLPASGFASVRSGKKLAAAAAVLVIALAGGLYWGLGAPGRGGFTQTLETPRGEQRTVQLADGSVLALNVDTRVRIRYSPAQRLIEFEHGQALFNVARNPQRPFVVRAGGTDVVAVGTQFEVLKRAAGGPVTVTVLQGKVDVRRGEGSETAAAPARIVRVTAQQRVRVVQGQMAPVVPELIDVYAAVAWQYGELVFSEQRLAEVAEEFSRYGTPIEIDTAALRDYRVSGVFNARDTESFVTYLRRIGEVERTGNGYRVR